MSKRRGVGCGGVCLGIWGIDGRINGLLSRHLIVAEDVKSLSNVAKGSKN
jgi:hypothetical protein